MAMFGAQCLLRLTHVARVRVGVVTGHVILLTTCHGRYVGIDCLFLT